MRHAAADLGDHSVEAADLGKEGVAILVGEGIVSGGRLRPSGSRNSLRVKWTLLSDTKAELPILVITPNVHLVELDRAHELFTWLRAPLSSLLLARSTKRFINAHFRPVLLTSLPVVGVGTLRPFPFLSLAPLP